MGRYLLAGLRFQSFRLREAGGECACTHVSVGLHPAVLPGMLIRQFEIKDAKLAFVIAALVVFILAMHT